MEDEKKSVLKKGNFNLQIESSYSWRVAFVSFLKTKIS